MAQTFNNGESLASIRAKLNANAEEIDGKAGLASNNTFTGSNTFGNLLRNTSNTSLGGGIAPNGRLVVNSNGLNGKVGSQVTIDGTTNDGSTTTLALRNNSGTEQVTFLTNGNVGIGTTSPAYKLDVNGTAKVSGTFYWAEAQASGGYGINFRLANAGSTQKFGFQDNTGAQIFGIYNTGNVGIGTTAPTSKLQVVGLPTSSVGLTSGAMWRNGTVVNIVA